jgi:hypothetical protein
LEIHDAYSCWTLGLKFSGPIFINCIKNLSSEIEGIIRTHYLDEKKTGKRVSFQNKLIFRYSADVLISKSR